MAWNVEDFVVFGAMFAGVGIVWALARRTANGRPYRVAVGVALVAAFLLIWINGAVGVIGHGRSGGANYWSEFQSKLLPLYPDADFYSLGHTHHLASKEIAGLRLDNNGDEVIRRQYFIRSGNYMRRSGSAYSQEAMYAPLPQGSPIVWFRSDGTVDPDVETLRYWSL